MGTPAIIFTTRIVHGRTHVMIEPLNLRNKAYKEADYLGTKLALIGVLKPSQTLDSFTKDWLKRNPKK